MKTLKKILLGVAAFVVLPLVVALFVQNDFKVERQIVINKPQPEVFAYLKHLKNQENFSKWVMADPNMKKAFRGTDGTVGFVYAWNGNDQAGEGEQEIKHLDGQNIDIEVRFKRPMESMAQAPFHTQALSDNQTKVTWGMQGSSPYPFNLMNLFTDKMLGGDLEASLTNLKGILEKETISKK